MRLPDDERLAISQRCQTLATKAEWERFITYYYTAFNHALTAALQRG